MENAEVDPAAPTKAGSAYNWYRSSVQDGELDQQTLRQREQHLQQLVDTLPTMVWAANPSGEPSYLNRRLIDYVGIELTDLDAPDGTRLQVAIQSSVHPDDADAVGKALVHAFSTGRPFAMKYRQRRADGVYRWTDGRAEPLRNAEGAIVQWYGVSFDIDEEVQSGDALRRAHDKLARSTQAAGLAELAASIAHEVNQPLAAILASANALERWVAADNTERALQSARSIARDAAAAAEVIERIRALFRGTHRVRRAVDVNTVIEDTIALMSEELRRADIALETQLDFALPPIVADRVQLQQVIVNLLRNGIEAMDLTARAQRQIGIGTTRMDGSVRVDVWDRGAGIIDVEKVFDPFFSTKREGMGMGLAICRSVIESHEGKLWVDSTGSGGTRFAFILPISS